MQLSVNVSNKSWNRKKSSSSILKKFPKKRTLLFLLILFVLTPIFYFGIQQYRIYKVRAAATIIWDGGGDGISWSDPLNWDTDVTPISSDSVLIDTATTINISAPTTIYSLTLGSVAGNIATTLQFNFDSITADAPLLIDGGNLTVYPSAVITHSGPSTTTINGTVNISITTGDASILGAIDVTGKGYKDGYGPGAGVSGSYGAGGASHAGVGGNGRSGLGGTTIYGSLTQPISLGSGGGDNNDSSGGEGGGAIKLTISGNLNVNGNISANGGNGIDTSYGSGGGAGGSVWISANSISGTSTISANGGDTVNASYDGGGGSGGRIALYSSTNSLLDSQISAAGGKPLGADVTSQRGGAGTIYTKTPSQTYGSLRIDNIYTNWSSNRDRYAVTPINTPLTLDTLTLNNYAKVANNSTITTTDLNIKNYASYFSQSNSTTNYTNLDWTGSTVIDNGGTFNLVSNGGDLNIPANTTLEINIPRTYNNITVSGILSHSTNVSEETNKLNITTTGDVTVNEFGSINVNEKGYKDGYGPGAGVDGNGGAGGASHAGVGGNGRARLGSTIIYGSLTQPVSLGSGGGDDNDSSGGEGGGAIKLTISGNLNVNGGISANGGNGSIDGNDGGGGGAGGSIWISANTISGTSTISANGGNAVDAYYDGGGAGGGRIALYLKDKLSVPLANLSVNGGTAYGSAQPGGSGSLQILGYPYKPISLQQFKLNDTTAIAIGGSTEENSFIAKFQVDDANSPDTLIPEVEIQPVGTPFNNIATHTGTEITYSGTTITSSTTIDGMADTQAYHWQARVCDTGNPEISLCSGWVSAGNNSEQEPDISVIMNANPNSPVIGESSYYINGQYTNFKQPTFGFVLSDPNSLDSIGYQFQLAKDSSFSDIIIDYLSAMGAQGVQYFTVGQQVGEGTYNIGDANQELSAGSYFWRVKSIDNKNGSSDWSIALGNPSFIIDLSLPTNATNVRMKPYADSINEYSESENDSWFNRNDLYFEWDEGTDAQGIKGYCLYLGDLSDGNPGAEKGLLGDSPLSTSGSTCQFITDQTNIDFSNSAFRGTAWLTSRNTKYYFKIKTIDIANNIYDGPDTTNYISFYFDNTSPENVTAISAPSTTFSSLSDIFFTWPTTENNGGSDLHSGLLGFQFALNTKNTWYGSELDSTTGLYYYSLSTPQPFHIPEDILPLIQLGQNTIFFRILDAAGNTSELRTVYINYGGESPKFPEGEEVTVNPTTGSTNYFSFSWPQAIISEGNTLKTYYYMINTEPPSSYQTITSNSATYIPTTQTAIGPQSFSGLRKGSNTIYVVAVDDKDNYSSSNYISATFTLNTDLPDSPTNIIIADSSIKEVSLWRAALIWDEPEYKGTGTLRYTVQRSENGTTWTTVQNTTGLAHIDTVPMSKQYYWRIGTTDNSDESINSPSYSGAVSITPRGKYTSPANLTSGPAVSSITTTHALISWTTNRNSDSKIEFGLASGNYFDWEPSVSQQTTEHKIPLSNLKPGTQYFYVSKWTDEDGNTGTSEEKFFTTAPAPEVKDVRISNLGISSTILNFTTKNATNAKIYYGTTTSFGGIKEIGTSKLETTYSVELNNLQDGTKYYYKINTFDEEGEEYEGTILDFKTLPRPKVSNVLVQQVAKTAQSTLLVTWESNTEISSIISYYPERNPELIQDVVDLKMINGNHKMLIKGLLPDTAYILNVRGKDVIGNEAISGNIKINTSSDTRPPKISEMNIEGSNINLQNTNSQNISSQLIVTWTTDEPATSQVEYGEGSSDSYSQLTQEDKNLSYNHVVVISGLTPSKVYHLRAISRDSANNESSSIDTVTITPKSTDSAFNLVISILQEAFTFLTNL